ncbi:hypothetical protein FQR65_LT12131 [Abscondita terminalis]|nr:hypothetical protein FQR65_LT12131 [Abscondita terminalis]
MARHRNVRSMNYTDEYDGYDDVYGHSVEDDYCVSPSEAAFMYDREGTKSKQKIGAFFQTVNDIAEENEGEMREASLSDVDKARLESCIEQIRGIVGNAVPKQDLINIILLYNFNAEKALNFVLGCPQYKDVAAIAEKKANGIGKINLSGPVTKSEVDFAKSDTLNNYHVDLSKALRGVNSSPQLRTVRVENENFTPSFIDCEIIADNAPQAAPSKNVRQNRASRSFLCLTDNFRSPERPISKPFRLSINDVFKGTGSNFCVSGRLETGNLCIGDRVLVCPSRESAIVKALAIEEVPQQTAFAGDQATYYAILKKPCKYEQESKKLGKQSFMYAWVLDETGEERNRGITMDVGRSQFETKTKLVTLLDAPGHKDFIPNMISGAGQADVALLVVDATRGEFETGFDYGGQTREHALLVRSLGVSQLAVAINKLDTVTWSQERFNEITQKLKTFLKQAGFKENDVTFVPCSGLTGQNLVDKPTEIELVDWYNGPCLLDVIDNFRSPERPISKPFRLSINDVFKGTGSNFCVSGRLETGNLCIGDRVLVCPSRESAIVKALAIEEVPQQTAFAGDQVSVTLSGIEMQNVSIGYILCDPQNPVQIASKFQARIVVFNVSVPITKGYSVVIHHQSLVEPAVITKLINQLHKSTGEILKKHPRCLSNNSSAMIEIQVSRPIALELYSECKELGRIMIRVAGVTIAAGLITKVIS